MNTGLESRKRKDIEENIMDEKDNEEMQSCYEKPNEKKTQWWNQEKGKISKKI